MRRFLITMFFPLIGCCFNASAQGDLLVTPTRVVFEGNKQKEVINLVNIGEDTATYSISFLQYNMKEDGGFEAIVEPDSGQMFATPHLRIFPRQVTLAPGEPQVVMLQFRQSPDMLAGEYRSHLYFRAEKDSKPLGSIVQDTSILSVQLIPIYGISIPIIIRLGQVNVTSSLSKLSLETLPNLEQHLMLTINRAGNKSVYGNIIIHYIPTQGKSFEITTIKGIGVYTNINKRNIVIKLDNKLGKPLTGGKLKVQFTSPDGIKRTIYAEAELFL